MLIIIVRIIFVAAIFGASLTGDPQFAFLSLIPGVIIFFLEGKEGLMTWGGLAVFVALLLYVLR